MIFSAVRRRLQRRIPAIVRFLRIGMRYAPSRLVFFCIVLANKVGLPGHQLLPRAFAPLVLLRLSEDPKYQFAHSSSRVWPPRQPKCCTSRAPTKRSSNMSIVIWLCRRCRGNPPLFLDCSGWAASKERRLHCGRPIGVRGGATCLALSTIQHRSIVIAAASGRQPADANRPLTARGSGHDRVRRHLQDR